MKFIIGNVSTKIEYAAGTNEYARYYPLLRDYLRIKVPGAHYVQRKGWDGYRYFITASSQFATGFLQMVVLFIEREGAKLEFEDQRKNKVTFTDRPVVNFDDASLRQYQEEGVLKVMGKQIQVKGCEPLFFPRGIIDAATNAGKDYMMASIYLSVRSAKALLLVSNSDVYRKATKFFKTLFPIGEISPKKFEIAGFTIAMQKTLYNRAESSIQVRKYLSEVNVLFVDEAHESGSKEYSRLVSMVDAYVRVLVSGTPLDTSNPINNLIIVGLCGNVIFKITNKFLMDEKVSLRAIVRVFRNPAPLGLALLYYEDAYAQRIMFSQTRADILIEQIRANPDKKILVAFRYKEQGKYLLEKMMEWPELVGRVDMVEGTDPDREEKVEWFTNSKRTVLLSSVILRQGVNIKDINVLAYAMGGRSKVDVKQFVGRAVRDDGISESIEVWDFYDEGKWVSAHSKFRVSLYKNEEFEIRYEYPATPSGAPKGSRVGSPTRGRFFRS
ncbi:SSL2 DNA or RNA helicases of superfamily II [uncultured Caudovirales phage]|uniref:SSL2 DNA or RNA helicases of superfamily II n=1 Tax=uncultured Caudovirales phage TaxID=2100421 RepID=A0A6J5QNJ3_9CAUD|nr:SSL2 DNA or RNA helicases of superfamily II [uncultured Caudovirales phage]CAB4193060.1 SSL2 DNA or RNA helicases of superfamily II [uncultured Caudovirales phage]CAB4217737.1 SSL2 DNA or RNA helicases of superfamily II [uncultured Caudovirales phage]CAB5231557.1 SSL2 DNA or RNA helicases of superfamily II [uncultured Caudovirales phage]